MAKFKPTFTIRFGAARNDLTAHDVVIQGQEGTVDIVIPLPPATGFKYPFTLDRKDARRELSAYAKVMCERLNIVERTKPQRRAA